MKAQQLKNSILQMAIQGKLVPQDPNDEPASVLLERIRKEKEQMIKEGKIKKEKNPSVIFKGSDNLYYEKVGKEIKCIQDELPFDIPESWTWVRFPNLFELVSGRDLTPQFYSDKEIGIPYITGASNFENGNLIINRWTNAPQAVSIKEDLLITCKGTIGEMAVLKLEQVHIARQVMAIRNYFFDNTKYLQLFLSTYIETLRGKAKSMIPGISREDILSIILPLPPYNEQRRIVNKFEEIIPYINSYDEKESELSYLNVRFPELLKKSILQQAIQGKLVPQDPNDEPASVLLERIRKEKQQLIKEGKIKKDKNESIIYRRDNSHYEKCGSEEICIDDEIPFDIPESWEWIRLGSLLKIESGKPLTSKEMKTGKIPVYGGNGITGYHDEHFINKETVVIGRVGYYCGSVHITEKKAWVTDNAFITTYPDKYIDRNYLVYTLRFMNLGQNNNATAQPVVSGKKIYPLLFPFPPLSEQIRISAKLKELLALCNKG